MEVGTETRDEAGQRVVTTAPAQRQMTIQDLLRHTSGLTYGVLGRSAIKSMYRKAGIYSTQQTMAERVTKLAKLPLVFEPGARWEYGHSTDVLGRVIEVVSGQSLDEFLADRLFGPLAMKDTGFWVKPDSQGRLAQAGKDSKTGRSVELLNVTGRPALLSGGGGGVSTAEDYLIFAQMLLSGGWINGVRILSPKTVDYMTADHLGTIPGFLPGNGFGLGFGARTAVGVSAVPGSVGTYYWGGWAGTVFWVDPEEEMVAILMVQAPAESDRLSNLFYTLVYQALVD
jgi:CubicO group peptidase (beta-lactamase class C family)